DDLARDLAGGVVDKGQSGKRIEETRMSANERLGRVMGAALCDRPPSALSSPRKQRRKLRVQLVLEVHIEHRSPQHRHRRRGQCERTAKLVEEHSDQAEGALLIEDRQANVGAARRLDRREIELFPSARVVQTTKSATVDMASKRSRGGMNRGGERARAHHIDL